MEEKKNIKISLSTFFLILAIITIIVMGVFIYKLNKDKIAEIQKSTELQDQVNSLSESVSNLQEKINNINQITSNGISGAVETEKNIILYNGYEIEIKTGIQYISDMKNTEETKQKYNAVYYNYEDGKYEGTTNGKFGEETYEGYSQVSNVKRIAMTQKYNAIPRNVTRIKELPKELIDMADYTSVTIDSIDLDNDGKEEKVVCYTVSYPKGEIGDGEPKASSGMMIFDSNYKKIADLVSLKDGFWSGIKEEDKKIFLSLDKIEYIDIDNDDIMEIIIEVPTYDGTCISILKYNNDNIEGKTNFKASVMP